MCSRTALCAKIGQEEKWIENFQHVEMIFLSRLLKNSEEPVSCIRIRKLTYRLQGDCPLIINAACSSKFFDVPVSAFTQVLQSAYISRVEIFSSNTHMLKARNPSSSPLSHPPINPSTERGWNFSKSQSLYRGGGKERLPLWARVVCSRLVFGEVTSPNTRTSEAYCCKLTGRVKSLYGGDKRVTPRQQAEIEGRGSSIFFQISEPV